MKKYIFATAVILLSSQAFAKDCTVNVPRGCHVFNSQMSTNSGDGNSILQVDCRFQNGQVSKYMVAMTNWAGVIGMGRAFVPNKMTFLTWDQDKIALTCK